MGLLKFLKRAGLNMQIESHLKSGIPLGIILTDLVILSWQPKAVVVTSLAVRKPVLLNDFVASVVVWVLPSWKLHVYVIGGLPGAVDVLVNKKELLVTQPVSLSGKNDAVGKGSIVTAIEEVVSRHPFCITCDQKLPEADGV